MFYEYNSKKFGDHLRTMRKALKLTQKNVAVKIGFSVDGLRKIENGFVTPRFETLIILSSVYKCDLIRQLPLYMKIPELNDYYIMAQNSINNADIHKLSELKYNLEKEHKQNNYNSIICQTDLKQFLFFCDASLLFLSFREQSLFKSKSIIIEALNFTIPNLNENNLLSQNYNDFEIRFIHLYALVERRLKNHENALRIILFLLENIPSDINNNENLKNINSLYFTASYTYHELGNNLKALEYSIKGIDFSRKNNRYDELHLHFYRKGVAEFLLNDENYNRSFQKSINFLEVMNPKLAEDYRKITYEKYNIILKS